MKTDLPSGPQSQNLSPDHQTTSTIGHNVLSHEVDSSSYDPSNMSDVYTNDRYQKLKREEGYTDAYLEEVVETLKPYV